MDARSQIHRGQKVEFAFPTGSSVPPPLAQEIRTYPPSSCRYAQLRSAPTPALLVLSPGREVSRAQARSRAAQLDGRGPDRRHAGTQTRARRRRRVHAGRCRRSAGRRADDGGGGRGAKARAASPGRARIDGVDAASATDGRGPPPAYAVDAPSSSALRRAEDQGPHRRGRADSCEEASPAAPQGGVSRPHLTRGAQRGNPAAVERECCPCA